MIEEINNKLDIKIGNTYRHFKGFIATVIAIAKHSETGETLVVYECKVPNSLETNHKGGIFARPIEMWFEKVDKTKYPNTAQEYRFEMIKECKAE